MLNLTEYWLSKLAEECLEVGKEALKGQQQGLDSTHRGRSNLEYVQDELDDVCSILGLLAYQSSALALAFGDYNKSDDGSIPYFKQKNKRYFFALMAFQNKHLLLTKDELQRVVAGAYVHDETATAQLLTEASQVYVKGTTSV